MKRRGFLGLLAKAAGVAVAARAFGYAIEQPPSSLPMGGPLMSSSTYMIGEHGPETITMHVYAKDAKSFYVNRAQITRQQYEVVLRHFNARRARRVRVL